MITSNIKYPFGRKLAMVETPAFTCLIKTSKESLFTKQSTNFSEITEGTHCRRLIARFRFNDHLGSSERLTLHDIIVGKVDEAGANGKPLRDALRELFEEFGRKGLGHGQRLDDS